MTYLSAFDANLQADFNSLPGPTRDAGAFPIYRLCDARAGSDVWVMEVEHDADGIRLAELGIETGRRLTIVRGADPMICEIYGARVALGAGLASRVTVSPRCHGRETSTIQQGTSTLSPC